eukprot:12404063-Prorocentrum_lima.AAC.1
MGRVISILAEKNSEFAEDNPLRKYKGCVVFQGNNVRDENWEVVTFRELSSSPPTMAACKVADTYALLP